MNRRTFLRAGTAVMVPTVAGLAGCLGGDDGDDSSDAGETGGDAGDDQSEDHTVSMTAQAWSMFFDPVGLYVEPGDTVTFRLDEESHSTVAYHEDNELAEETRISDDAEPWSSDTFDEQGATFQRAFDAQGTYDYYCGSHKDQGMVGRIVVGEPGGPAEGSEVPDGNLPESQRIVDERAIEFLDFASEPP